MGELNGENYDLFLHEFLYKCIRLGLRNIVNFKSRASDVLEFLINNKKVIAITNKVKQMGKYNNFYDQLCQDNRQYSSYLLPGRNFILPLYCSVTVITSRKVISLVKIKIFTINTPQCALHKKLIRNARVSQKFSHFFVRTNVIYFLCRFVC